MKRAITLSSLLLIFSIATIKLQAQPDVQSLPKIEIIGNAEKEIDPDEIYIQVILKEYFDRKTKITIEAQETKLQSGLKAAGIGSENIVLNAAGAGYVSVKIFKKDVVTTKSYQIKCSSAEEVKKVFEVLDGIQINNAYITKVSHSKLKEFKRALRIEAIKDAKVKAGDLVTAVGNDLDNPILIKEIENGDLMVRGSRSNATDYYLDGIRVGAANYKEKNEAESVIQYQKIKLRSKVYVQFLIE